ncbi:hypothetical protein DPMN_174296 [Dreissena polymorpha]|uniref:non-specific serine/threonine protein kinase n=1 Tax=Dreissena polymorpha TaxID=45954 RepID=A0A9D4E655_DREPO|nr:hypothetical protein DPMN_174296 [Dreissena polymorpha]
MAAPVDEQDEREFIKQGAEAKVFRETFYGRPCISKERFSKAYRHASLDKTLTFQRLKSEIRAMNKCRLLGKARPNFLSKARLVIVGSGTTNPGRFALNPVRPPSRFAPRVVSPWVVSP